MDDKALAEVIGKAISDAIASDVLPMVQLKLESMRTEFHSYISAELANRAGRDGQPGRDGVAGANGKDGAPGKDASIGRDVSYWNKDVDFKRDEAVSHRGGIFVANFDNRDAEPGSQKAIAANLWLCIANGICDLRAAPTANAFEFTLLAEHSDGTQRVCGVVALPMPEHKGLHTEGQEYKRLNMVALNGSTWIAVTDTKASPGESPDWKLMAQKGDRGKRGPAANETDSAAVAGP